VFANQLLKFKTVDEVLWGITKYAIVKLNYEDCIVYLYDYDLNSFVQRAAHGPKNVGNFEILNRITLKFGEGICGDVAAKGVGEIVNDTSVDKRYIADDNERLSELTVPISIDGKIVGLIDSEHRLKNYYSSQDLKTLEAICNVLN